MFVIKSADDAKEFIETKVIPAHVCSQLAHLVVSICDIPPGRSNAEALAVLKKEIGPAIERLERDGTAQCLDAAMSLPMPPVVE